MVGAENGEQSTKKIENVSEKKNEDKDAELEKKTDKLFALDGSNKEMTKQIKRFMDYPKSYKYSEAKHRINEDGKTIEVIQGFREKGRSGRKILNFCGTIQDIETGKLTDFECDE